jgi:hypothetical protein
MSSVIGGLSRKVGVATRPYRKAPMTNAIPTYTTTWDVIVPRCGVDSIGDNLLMRGGQVKRHHGSNGLPAIALPQGGHDIAAMPNL